MKIRKPDDEGQVLRIVLEDLHLSEGTVKRAEIELVKIASQLEEEGVPEQRIVNALSEAMKILAKGLGLAAAIAALLSTCSEKA